MDDARQSAQWSLFAELIGPAYCTLALPVQRLHAAPDGASFSGTASVKRGNWLSRIAGAFASLPPAKENSDLQVSIHKHQNSETWQRTFSGTRMNSKLSARNDLLHEQLGFLQFSFLLAVDGDELHWHIRRVAFLGVPLPLAWFGSVSAREYAIGKIYCFEVSASLPLIGLLLKYSGKLQVP